jgi:DNA polymerase III delta prime subunit
MRDGKPSFILLDFKKYETIMAEYDKLKMKKSKDKSIPKKVTKEITNKVNPITEKELDKIIPAKVIPPTPILIQDKVDEENILEIKKQSIEEVVELEVKEGLEVLDDLDFDDEFKKEVERKVRERKDRELAVRKVNEEKNKVKTEDTVIKPKKQAELKEFWAK